ncbi:MAG: hypothetical protein E7177_07785 [Erysipelotrichaceae bacterium]|nr:hypothetical protein [Erysipelotrichaceae bacterium]
MHDEKFPFWGRLKIGKRRPTLVIDNSEVLDKKKKKMVPGYVHRETTHTEKKDYEVINPNPDPNDNKPMYLKRPSKLPKNLIKKLDQNFNMPSYLIEKYDKNNKKIKK